MRGGQGTVGKLMTDEQLYAELQPVRRVGRRADRGHPAGPRHARASSSTIRRRRNALEASLQEHRGHDARSSTPGEGSLGKLLNDDSVRAIADVGDDEPRRRWSRKLNRGEGTAGKLMTDPALFNRLNAVTERLDQLRDAV